ncbi:MAG: flagellar filament capping protein FliD [Candidatus Magnetoovum sp. WYHC-5]|nr:flagellar filament capping protein FliD [Candidatus Magnetoovum sp. WYHC-5]
MSITTGIGAFSGIDYNEMVEKLMEIERQPLTQLQEKKDEYNTKISALGELSSSISSLRTALKTMKIGTSTSGSSATSSSPSAYASSSSNANVVTATSTGSAVSGEYDVTVHQVAQKLKLKSQDFSSSSTVFNSGTISINLNGTVTDISINYTNSTLEGVKNAINTSGTAAKASIIHGDSGYRLIISADTGGSGSLTITTQDNSSAANSLSAFATDGGEGSLTVYQSAQDAIVEIDGVTVTSSSNEITDAISGLKLSLHSASETPVQISVNFDADAASENLQSFIDTYNTAMQKAKELSNKDGDLAYDSVVKRIVTQLRGITTTTYGSGTLAQYGITHDDDDNLELDTSKLEKAIANGESGLTNTLNSLATSFDTTLKNMINEMLPGRSDTFEAIVDSTDDKITNLEYILELKELSYTKKFSLLEQTIGELQQSGNSMLDSLSNLNA